MTRKNIAQAPCPAERLVAEHVPSRMHVKDSTLYDFSDVALDSARNFMGWTDLASNPPTPIEQIEEFAALHGFPILTIPEMIEWRKRQ